MANRKPGKRSGQGGEQTFNVLGGLAWVAIFAALGVAATAGWMALRDRAPAPLSQAPKQQQVTLGGQPFTLELALTDTARTEGLMGRPSMADNHGMLFAFGAAKVRTFWMKNCLIPLDIIFLDAEQRIVSIHTLPPPAPGTARDKVPTCTSAAPAQYVIELNAGRAESVGLKPGQKLELPVDQLKRHVR